MRGIAVVVSVLAVFGAPVAAGAQPAPAPAETPQTSAPPAGSPGRAGGGGRGARRPVHIPSAPDLGYVAVENPLRLPEGMAFGAVSDVAVNSKGHVFVYHREPLAILEFDADGNFVRGFGEGESVRPHGIRIDRDDNIWIADVGGHTVSKLNPQGEVLLTLGTKGEAGTWDEAAGVRKFDLPSDIAIAPNGDIFVATGEGGGPDPRVVRFDRTGRFLTTWSMRPPDGSRSNPHTIEVDRNGLLYVGDRELMRIRVFQPDGTHVRDIQLQNQVCGLFIDHQQQLWVATAGDGMILKVDYDGNVLAVTGRRGTGLNEYGEAHLMAVGPKGEIYVADNANRRVQKLIPK